MSATLLDLRVIVWMADERKVEVFASEMAEVAARNLDVA